MQMNRTEGQERELKRNEHGVSNQWQRMKL